MNLVGWVQALNGTTLILVIAALLFIEEVGVPLVVVPGDFLLAVAGVAVAARQVPAVEALAICLAAVIAGAITGRELFALLGLPRLLRLARALGVAEQVQRVSAILQRRGWRAVFTARLIPGLRVYTTQVAGVIGMPRKTFIAGLVPAAAVYVGAFVGLGAAFGRPILQIIRTVEHQALPYGIAIVVVVVAILLLRGLAWRGVKELAGGTWADAMVVRVNSPSGILVPTAIGLNFIGHAIAVELKLPLFLDTTGTVLAGILGGPWIGASVGVVTNLVSANSIDPNAGLYAPVSFAIGFVAGLVRRQGWLHAPGGWLVLWALSFFLAVVISTPINLLVYGGGTGVPFGDLVVNRLSHTVPLPVASLAGEAAVDLPDKLLAVLVAFLIYRGLPAASAPGRAVEVDLRQALTFLFRSPRWRRTLLYASLCILFSWLVIPLVLLTGYLVEVARLRRDGKSLLPEWDRPRSLLKDGALILVASLVWNAPSIALAITGEAGGWEGIVVAGNLVGLFVGIIMPAVWAQYLAGGLRGSLSLLAVARRVRLQLGLTLVIGVVSTVLPVVGLIGVIGLAVGVFPALAYTFLVIAHLFGEYAAATEGRELQPVDRDSVQYEEPKRAGRI